MDKWPKKKLGEIAVEIFSGSELTAKQMAEPGYYPCVRNKDISKLGYYFSECPEKVDATLLTTSVFISQGDVVMSDMGTEKGLGMATAYLGDKSPLIGNSVVAVRHNENPIFLAHAINSPFVRAQVRMKMQGTIVQHLRVKDLRNLEIPLPDIETQEKVVKVIKQMDQNLLEARGIYESYEDLYKQTIWKLLNEKV